MKYDGRGQYRGVDWTRRGAIVWTRRRAIVRVTIDDSLAGQTPPSCHSLMHVLTTPLYVHVPSLCADDADYRVREG